MKIIHCCLSCFYIDNYSYQENILPIINKQDGNDVLIIASTETYIDNSRLGYISPSTYETPEGIKVIRLPYTTVINQTISRKIRKYKGVYECIEDFKPDVIMMHDLCFLSAVDIIKYKKQHPEVVLYADTHTAKYNSGQNWLSLHILHRIFYKNIIKYTLPYVEKYYYIGCAEREFNVINYNVPEERMEFLPLGGLLVSDEEYEKQRKLYRESLGVKDDTMVFLHSGKIDSLKNTDELIKAFSSATDLNAILVIIGSFTENESYYSELIEKDRRIQYLGWKKKEDLQGYLCASDLYCQPGSPSATLQNAVCCRNPVLAYPYDCYKDIDCGNFIWASDLNELIDAFSAIAENRNILSPLKEKTMVCARELLDYQKMAKKLTVIPSMPR